MGANASLHFALLFQDLVERVITLDTVKPAVFPINELADRTKQDIQNFLSLEERAKRIKNPDPVFSYDTAIQTLKVAHSPIGNYLFVIIILIRKHLKSICVIFIKETSHPKAPLVF